MWRGAVVEALDKAVARAEFDLDPVAALRQELDKQMVSRQGAVRFHQFCTAFPCAVTAFQCLKR